MSRENDRPQQYWKEPPKETSYEAHLRRKRLKQQQRSRSPKTQVPSQGQDSVGAREDERGREGLYGRPPTGGDAGAQEDTIQAQRAAAQEETPQAPRATIKALPTSQPLPRPYSSSSEDDYETESDLPSELPRQRTRSIGDMGKRAPVVRDRRDGRAQGPPLHPTPPPPLQKTTRHLSQAKRRRAWPWLLVGCAGGILTIALIGAIVLVIFFHTTLGGALFGGVFNQTFTQKNQQTFQVSNFSFIQINNKVGNVASNVTIVVDPTASTTTVTTVKKVQAGNSSDANKELARIPLILSPVNPATPTLILTICSQSNTACGNIGDSVDVTITLPTSTNADGSYLFDVETRVGNLSVQQAQLAAGSCLSTGTGNVIFKGSFDTTNSSILNPCGQPTSNTHPWYKIHSEVGNLEITPFPTIKNVLLDASTTAGKINSDGFNLNIQTSNGSESYYGPLIPNAPPPTAELTLDVGTGDINLHKI